MRGSKIECPLSYALFLLRSLAIKAINIKQIWRTGSVGLTVIDLGQKADWRHPFRGSNTSAMLFLLQLFTLVYF